MDFNNLHDEEDVLLTEERRRELEEERDALKINTCAMSSVVCSLSIAPFKGCDVLPEIMAKMQESARLLLDSVEHVSSNVIRDSFNYDLSRFDKTFDLICIFIKMVNQDGAIANILHTYDRIAIIVRDAFKL